MFSSWIGLTKDNGCEENVYLRNAGNCHHYQTAVCKYWKQLCHRGGKKPDILSLFASAEMIYEQQQPASTCILRVKQMNFPSSVATVAALVLWGLKGRLLPASPTPSGKHNYTSSAQTQAFQLHIYCTLQNNTFPPPEQSLSLCSARLPLVEYEYLCIESG